MKRIFSSIVFASLAIASFAGGLLTNTNQSAAFVRNPARYASLDADAVYFNPAGTAFLKEGWTVSANWQMIWQQRDVENGGKKYNGEVYVPIMPTFHATYKTGDWAFSAFFGMPGGGGNAKFDDGLPMFNTMGGSFAALAPVFNMGQPATGNAYSQFESTQYLFALQLGAAYQINDNLSVYGGLRTNYTSLNYEGSIYMPAGQTTLAPLSLELTQTGVAFAPVIGIDYKVGKLNIGVKYEFRAVNTIENDTEKLAFFGVNVNKDLNVAGEAVKTNYTAIGKAMQNGLTQEQAIAHVANDAATQATINGTANAAVAGLKAVESLKDGEKFRNDAPAKLSVGVSYDICDRVKVMGAGVYYFDKDAKIESLIGKANTMKKLSRNTYELLAGVEVKVTDKLLLSSGIQFSDFGVNEGYLSDVSFIDDSFTVGAGGKYSFNENWDLNFGAIYANYAHGAGATGSHYLRKTYNVAVGVDFRF
ncbi:MAG: outer membrane beta-barrel protein [Bacteroidaceae bacterium]|nr:outer membrane beta-barrel protein [Bacteroidaceae bacterium]